MKTTATQTLIVPTIFPATAYTAAQWQLIEQAQAEGQDVDHLLKLDPWSHDVQSMLTRVAAETASA